MRWVRVGAPVLLGATLIAGITVRMQDESGRALPEHVRHAAAAEDDHVAGQPRKVHARRPVPVRIALERSLGHHAVLAIRMMRAEVEDFPDYVITVRDALDSNTDDLVGTVRSVHGAKPGRAFGDLWTDHNIALYRYARAVASGSPAAKQRSVAQLDRYRRNFGRFVESATRSQLKASAVSKTLKTHIDHLLEQTEAYAAGDYASAYRLQRKAYAHMFPTGKTLAEGLTGSLPGEFPVHVDEPTQELRSALALLLGEHVELAVDATRAGLRGSPEFEAAAAALNHNTRDLSEAFDALFGVRNARRFNDIWSDHIDQLVDYTIAVATQEENDANEVRAQLREFQRKLAGYLANLTGARRRIGTLRHEIGMHEDLLVRQVDAYAAENYNLSHRVSYRMYQDMFATATELGAIIGKKAGKASPAGGAQTGGGGTK